MHRIPSLGLLCGTLFLVSTLLTGCPRKLTEQVKVEVPGDCAPPPAPPAEPALADLTMVAAVRVGEVSHAVVATANFAKVVTMGDSVGAESATVQSISPDGITLSLPNSPGFRISHGEELHAPASPQNATSVAELPEEQRNQLTALTTWRRGLIRKIGDGYGVPVHVLQTLSLALTDHEGGAKAALDALGWDPVVGISSVYLTVLRIEQGAIKVLGVAPNRRILEQVMVRLKSAHPLIETATIMAEGRGEPQRFELELKAPLIPASHVAIAGATESTMDLPNDLQEQLKTVASTAGLPDSYALGGLDADLQNLATQNGLNAVSVQRQDGTVEDGSLGMVSYSFSATGRGAALLSFLKELQEGSTIQHPVVVDPLTVQVEAIQGTIRVPYTTGKADTRNPLPAPLILPTLSNDRWTRALNEERIRDPFRR